MLKRYAATIILFIFTATTIHAQFVEDFEDGDGKGGWAAGFATLSSGTWFMDEALLRTDADDKKNGTRAVRIRSNGNLQMNFDITDGASEVQFFLSNSGFSNDTGGVIQVQFSTDGGINWTDLGDEITAPDQLEIQSVPADISGNVRFRFLHRAGGRMNIDDLFIEPQVDLNSEPTLRVRRGNDTIEGSTTLVFPAVSTGSTRDIDLRFTNNGEQDLTINSVSVENGTYFSLTGFTNGTLASLEDGTVTITFNPSVSGEFSDVLTIESNDPNQPEFTLNLSGESLSEGDITPIATARQLEFGTRVTVSGRVSVANDFEGPTFFQDQTAGMAAFWPDLHTAVERGDSIIVTGPVTEFNPIGGTPGDFLFQIAEVDGDNDITFEVVDTAPVLVEPTLITVQQMNSGEFEGQLVEIENVSFVESGAFQGNQNFEISDATGLGELRIDNSVASLINAAIPEDPVSIVGVVDQFNGTYQIKPRDSEDLAVEEFELVGEDISRDLTFEAVTWNIEWFGNSGNGPDDLDLQMDNVITVIETVDADLYALQEISNNSRFFDLVDNLAEYSGFIAGFSQTQKTAYLFKTSVIDSLDSGLLDSSANQVAGDWANGRFPLFFEFNATIEGTTRQIYAVNIHAKAFGDEDSFNQRTQASLRLKVFLDGNKANDNILFLGDYNDRLGLSTYNNEISPYDNFVEDDSYFPVTKTLEDRGINSFIAGQNQSMIDHIIVTNDLILDHINGSQRAENPSFIGSFISTTSDHTPIWTRFDFSRTLVNIDDEFHSIPSDFELQQNYPNPFNPTTNIRFTLPQSSQVTIRVYDVVGREVATVANSDTFGAGSHTLTFDASGLSSGMYIYRMSLANGEFQTRKMMIIK